MALCGHIAGLRGPGNYLHVTWTPCPKTTSGDWLRTQMNTSWTKIYQKLQEMFRPSSSDPGWGRGEWGLFWKLLYPARKILQLQMDAEVRARVHWWGPVLFWIKNQARTCRIDFEQFLRYSLDLERTKLCENWQAWIEHKTHHCND